MAFLTQLWKFCVEVSGLLGLAAPLLPSAATLCCCAVESSPTEIMVLSDAFVGSLLLHD
jgi:hypothetical protein